MSLEETRSGMPYPVTLGSEVVASCSGCDYEDFLHQVTCYLDNGLGALRFYANLLRYPLCPSRFEWKAYVSKQSGVRRFFHI